jgi:hypothetical protein
MYAQQLLPNLRWRGMLNAPHRARNARPVAWTITPCTKGE